MEENFSKLEKRIRETLQDTNLDKVFTIFEKIKDPTICTGVGGSSVVSIFMSKILERKNGIIAINREIRDLLYEDLKTYCNVILASYSGKNYGVDIVRNTTLNCYLFSTMAREGINNISYINFDKEKSFISLASTLIPMSILLSYYLDGKNDCIYKIIENTEIPILESSSSNVYEIMSGYDSITAAKFLESTFVEAGIGIPIIHDKYAYCHGRSTLSYQQNHSIIYFYDNKKLDNIMLEELPKYYGCLITINSQYEDKIVNDFYLTYKSMLLAKQIALLQNKDLSKVNYSPIVRKLYYFKGEM